MDVFLEIVCHFFVLLFRAAIALLRFVSMFDFVIDAGLEAWFALRGGRKRRSGAPHTARRRAAAD